MMTRFIPLLKTVLEEEGGTGPILKWRGSSSVVLKATPKKYQDLVLWAWPQVN